jgi:hypothetical protein
MSPTRTTSPLATGLIELGASTARALDARRQALCLGVVHGTVWLTRTSTSHSRPVDIGNDLAGRDGRDLWLHAGDSLTLPRGSHWVAQAWPHARLQLQPHGQAPAAQAGPRRASVAGTARPAGQLCAQGAGLGRS